MGTIKVNSKNLNTQGLYEDEALDLTISLSYNENAITGELMSINGTIYKKSDKSYMGNFNGSRNNDSLEYSVSGVKLADMPKVYTALADIEAQITNGIEQVTESGDGEGGEQ